MVTEHFLDSYEVKERVLDVLRFNVSARLDASFEPRVDYFLDAFPQELAYRLTAEWRVPGEVLQDDTVVAEYPASLWDHLKSVLGFDHETVKVRVNEIVCFPDVPVPYGGPSCVRISWTEDVQALPQTGVNQ